MKIERCHLIELPQITDRRGNLTFIESESHLPFSIERVYYLHDVPTGEVRGGHAHKALHQMIIAISGSFDVILTDGANRRRVVLDRPSCGLYICPMIWRELENFAEGSLCLVLASSRYDETDYYRSYKDYLAAQSWP